MLTRNLLKKHGLDKLGICSSLYKYWQTLLYSYSCLRQKLSLWLHNEEEGLSQALLLTSVTYKYCNEMCNNTYNSVPIMQSKVVRNCLKCSQKHHAAVWMPLFLECLYYCSQLSPTIWAPSSPGNKEESLWSVKPEKAYFLWGVLVHSDFIGLKLTWKS